MEVDNAISILDFPHLCRFCLSHENLKSLELYQYILDLFNSLTNIVVLHIDELPSNICTQCIQTLENIMDFIHLAENNDANLRQTLVNRDEANLEYEKMFIRGTETDIVPFHTFLHICRFCLCQDNLNTFQGHQYLLEVVKSVMQIEVNLDDNLPQNICFTCIGKLRDISDFIVSSKNNDIQLKQALVKIKQERYFGESNEIKVFEKIQDSKLKTESFDALESIKIKKENEKVEIVSNEDAQPAISYTEHPQVFVGQLNGEDRSEVKNEDEGSVKEESVIFLHEEIKIEEDMPVSEKYIQREIIDRHLQDIARKKAQSPVARPFECTSCPKTYVHETQLAIHIRTHTGERPFQCSICQKSFARSSNLSVHMKMHVGHGKLYSCEMCEKTFSRKAHLDIHVRTHTGEKNFHCTTCLKSFVNKQNLASHMMLHTGEKPFICPECSKGFSRKAHLVVHIKMHKGENPFQCKVCSKNFYDVYSLSRHEGKQACGKALECEICSRKYMRLKDLEAHMRLHSGEKPFKCEFCPRTFYRRCLLNDHVKFHKPNKLYECEFCSRSFPHKGTLNRHLMSHTGEKPFACTKCPKAFRMKDDFNAHLRKHDGEDPYLCKFCVLSFSSKGIWRAHKKTHSGDRPFGCHACSKSFPQRNDLDEHMKIHLLRKKTQFAETETSEAEGYAHA